MLFDQSGHQLCNSDLLQVTHTDDSVFGSIILGMAVTPGLGLTTGFGNPKAYQRIHDSATLLL